MKSDGTPQQAVERAVAFLEKDAAKWRNDRGCATCHHGTMTVWALSEAKNRGYPVGAETLSDMVQWTKDQFVPRFSKPRDARPGWNLVSVPAIYLGVMSQTLPILSRDEINRVAVHLARHQEEDGAWLLPPPANGAPPTWESRESLALWAYLAWEPHVAADPQEATEDRMSRETAMAWLSAATLTETTQVIGLRLLLAVRTGKPAEQIQSGIERLLHRQNSDGGWSQVSEMPSDAYATGQSLWVLSFAGVRTERPEIGRAVSFLVENQREDGSWAMTSRNHPGVKTSRDPIRNPVPITYFGSAWATLGLVRSAPPVLDTIANQQRAFDTIREFGGRYEVDENRPGRPVVRVVVDFAVDDEQLANLTTRLIAFSHLESLHLKSEKITDAGLIHLKSLPQLRCLALENAAITDAGVWHLNTLTNLEELNLKGTKITEAGVHDIQKAMTKVKVLR
jgi:squalene-hopene cyclase-like protein